MTRLIALLLCAVASSACAEEPVRVFAAASLTDALTEAATQWQSRGHAAPVLVFGGSATLAKQIDAGAPADVFISADRSWMDYLRQRDRIVPGSGGRLFGNTLVLVAPAGRVPSVTMARGFDFAGAFDGKLCTGEPGVVPVGIYARQALEALGWWTTVEARVVGADDVRTALSFVERGECALGIVYATDAAASDAVETVAEFPPGTYAPITYPVALVRGARADSGAFAAWLGDIGEGGGFAVFRRHGFTRASE